MLASLLLALVLDYQVDLESATVAADGTVRGAVSFEVSEPIEGRIALYSLPVEMQPWSPFVHRTFDAAPAECVPGMRYRIAFRFEQEDDVSRLAASLGRPIAALETGEARVGVHPDLDEGSWLSVTITPAAPGAVTIGALAVRACEGALPPATAPPLARRLLELGVQRGWRPPIEWFSCAPVAIDLDPHDSFVIYCDRGEERPDTCTPFFYRARVGDEIAVHNPWKQESLCNFHMDGLNVGIAEGAVYTGKLCSPGLLRVVCDVHCGATLGWILVEE